jgi:hypothetical protein
MESATDAACHIEARKAISGGIQSLAASPVHLENMHIARCVITDEHESAPNRDAGRRAEPRSENLLLRARPQLIFKDVRSLREDVVAPMAIRTEARTLVAITARTRSLYVAFVARVAFVRHALRGA